MKKVVAYWIGPSTILQAPFVKSTGAYESDKTLEAMREELEADGYQTEILPSYVCNAYQRRYRKAA